MNVARRLEVAVLSLCIVAVEFVAEYDKGTWYECLFPRSNLQIAGWLQSQTPATRERFGGGGLPITTLRNQEMKHVHCTRSDKIVGDVELASSSELDLAVWVVLLLVFDQVGAQGKELHGESKIRNHQRDIKKGGRGQSPATIFIKWGLKKYRNGGWGGGWKPGKYFDLNFELIIVLFCQRRLTIVFTAACYKMIIIFLYIRTIYMCLKYNIVHKKLHVWDLSVYRVVLWSLELTIIAQHIKLFEFFKGNNGKIILGTPYLVV